MVFTDRPRTSIRATRVRTTGRRRRIFSALATRCSTIKRASKNTRASRSRSHRSCTRNRSVTGRTSPTTICTSISVMSATHHANAKKRADISRMKRESKRSRTRQPRKPVIGFEAEFTLFVCEQKMRPEFVFRNPQRIVRQRMIPRTGRSFHMPSGGAIYFDTGVIEVATPIIEIEPGCCARAGRSLWEQIEFLRDELDAWETRADSLARLEGFSTHFNVSVPPER